MNFLLVIVFSYFVSFGEGKYCSTPTLKRIDFEEFIPNNIDKNCDLAIFASHCPIPFEYEYSNRVTFLSKANKLYWTTVCTILILTNFITPTEAEEMFVRINYANIKLVLIFPLRNFGIADLKLAKQSFHKDIIVVGNNGTPVLSSVRSSYCRYTNPSCFLKGASLITGFSQVLPYLEVKGWNMPIPGAPISRLAPLTLSRLTKKVNFPKLKGVEGQFLKYLVEEYGITFHMIAPADMVYGSKLPNGTWIGKLGMLHQEDVEMVVGSLVGSFQKHELGEFSAPLYFNRFSLCSRKPQHRPDWQAPLKPFPWMVWITLFGCIIIVGPIIWQITKLHINVTKSSQKLQSVCHISAQGATTLLVEPWINPPGGPASLIIGAWLIACLILQCVYSSNLTACLSIVDPLTPVQTLKDVIDQTKTLLLFKGGTLDFFMRNSKDAGIRHIMKYQTKYINSSTQNGPSSLEDPKIVGTNEVGILKYKITKEGKKLSDYYFSPKPLMVNFVGWIFKRDHYLIPAVNVAILRATESGVVSKWYRDQYKILVNTSTTNHGNFKAETGYLVSETRATALSIGHTMGIITFWLYGMTFSVFVFVAEVILFRAKKAMHMFA